MKSILSILLLSFSLLTNAQYDPSAKQHLDKLSNKLKSYKTFKSVFVYKMKGPTGLDESYQGTVTVSGNNKFHLTTNSGIEVICDGENMCNYNEEDEEVMLYEFDESEDGIMTPNKVAEMYKEGFRYIMGTSEDPTTHLVELIPDKRDTEAVVKIKIYIKKSDGMIKKWEIHERTGNKYAVDVKSFTPNVAVTDKQFVCVPSNFPAGVEFNDLR